MRKFLRKYAENIIGIWEARVDTQEADAKGDLVSGQESIIRKTKEQIEEIKDKFALDRKQIELHRKKTEKPILSKNREEICVHA